jgi:hypothetical protein
MRRSFLLMIFLLASALDARSPARAQAQAQVRDPDPGAVAWCAEAGAFALVVEGTLEPVARRITAAIAVPTFHALHAIIDTPAGIIVVCSSFSL